MAYPKFIYGTVFETNFWVKDITSKKWINNRAISNESNEMELFKFVFQSYFFPQVIKDMIFQLLFELYKHSNSAKNQTFKAQFYVAYDLVAFPVGVLGSHNLYYPKCFGFCYRCGNAAHTHGHPHRISFLSKRTLCMMRICFFCTYAGYQVYIEIGKPPLLIFPDVIKCKLKYTYPPK
jgi:hypothetical protein